MNRVKKELKKLSGYYMHHSIKGKRVKLRVRGVSG